MMIRLSLVLLCLVVCVPGAWAKARILALTPAACEMLFAVGAGVEVVGVSTHCDVPETARHLPRIADYRHLFVEPALRLKPTLVVAGQADLPGLTMMKTAGVRVMVVHPTSVAAVFDAMRVLGKASGHVAEAGIVVGRLRRRFDHLVAAATNPPLPVFYEVWPQPLLTEGAPSFITDALACIGARNIFGKVPLETLRTSVEAVVRAQPRAIIIPVSAPGSLAARRAFWHHWLPHVPVIPVDTDLIQRPGPRLVAGMAELQQRLHAVETRRHAHR